MANFVISPNMNLPIPTPGQDPGPDYSINEQSCFTILDGHNHSPGSGVQINTNGININADLPINGNNLTLVKTINFQALLVPLSGISPNLGCIYVAGNELYYNDESGNVVQITNTGSVNAGAGSITGLPSGTASASYSSGSGTFVWQSATNTAANMDNASVTIREQVPGANGVTLSSPTALSADYSLIFPSGLPAGQRFMTLDNVGNIAAPWNVDNSTIEVASNLVQVKALGITGTQIANNTIDRTKLTPVGQQVSASCGSFNTTSTSFVPITNLSVTITTTGRPIILMIQNDSLDFSVIGTDPGAAAYIRIDDVGGFACGWQINNLTSLGLVFSQLIVPAAGTHTYTAYARKATGTSFSIFNYNLAVYEL